MYVKSFDVVKIKRFIARYGKPYTFQRITKDDYGEDTEKITTINITGVFHETSSYITENAQDGSIVRQKPQPMIMTLATENFDVKIGDRVQHNNTNYEVMQVLNINSMDVAFDISLKVIDNGTGFGC